MSSDRIRQHTVVAQVMAEIRGLISSGEFVPGDKIPTEKELAEQFGIGRSSIREAIKIFNYLGVLESRAAIGTFVRERSQISAEALSWSLLLGGDEVDELIDLRGSIELWSLLGLEDEIAAGSAEAMKTIAELRQIVTGMEVSAESGNREDLIEADFRFHYAIIRGSGNELFLSLYETLRSFLHGEIRQSQDDYDDPGEICLEHRRLITAFKSGDRARALRAHTDHMTNIKRRVRSAAAARDSKGNTPS